MKLRLTLKLIPLLALLVGCTDPKPSEKITRTVEDIESSPHYQLAVQGDAEAQVKLGLELRDKRSYFHPNNEEAVKWFLKSAEQGNNGGQYHLAQHYKRGLGVPRNYEEAAKWYERAAENNVRQAACSTNG
jgi:hypothetical protein